MADIITKEIEIQQMLKDAKLYAGEITGKLEDSMDAIEASLDRNKLDHEDWAADRKFVAIEQILYKRNGMYSGTIDGLVGPSTTHAREVYQARLVTTWRDKADEIFPAKKISSLADIDPNQLAFIRGIGATESSFSAKEAYSERFNQEDNNANVRQYGQDGADYGYYQSNGLDVKEGIRLGIDPAIAKHINGGGRGGQSTLEQQTIATHEYLKRKYASVYESVKSGTSAAFEACRRATMNHWFGLKDRPDDARKEFAKGATRDWRKIFPEVAKLYPTEVQKAPVASPAVIAAAPATPVAVPKVSPPRGVKPIWPKQAQCEDFYGEVGTNQVNCQLPFEMRLAWDLGSKLKSYKCHRKVKEAMERVWQRTFDTYGYQKIVDLQLDRFGGCLNVRQIRGGSNYSMHSWGIAVDIDPDRNGFKTPWKQAQMSKKEYAPFVQFWYDEGAINLGLERNFDSMHYQFARL